jgi:hypothetical protein
MSDEFWNEMGIELPNDAPQSVETTNQSYYKHPIGTYTAFIGRLTAKYKDSEGKRCEPTDVGASFSHFILPLWIKKFMGSNAQPTIEQLITDKLELPNRPITECYFPIVIMANDKKRMWQYHRMFESFKVIDKPELTVVKSNPANPQKKSMDFKALATYVGIPVKFVLDNSKSKKGNAYLDSLMIESLSRPPIETLKGFELAVNTKVEAERQSRQKEDTYVPPQAPSFDESELNDYISGDNPNDDLPF